MRDKDGNRLYKNHEGYTLEWEGYDADGNWVNYTALTNGAMQWWSKWKWGNDAHTSIIYEILGNTYMPGGNLTEILAQDIDALYEGAFLGFCIEENTPDGIWVSSLVENIVRADNKKVCLTANMFVSERDSYLATMDDIILSYTPGIITSSAQIINDTQIRVRFSRPVNIDPAPFMAIRLMDKDGNLMWHGKVNASTPYQWRGSWEWEDDSHTSIIWTMYGGEAFGVKSLYDMANYTGGLEKFKGVGTWKFVIEELEKKDNNGQVAFRVYRNNLVENVVSLDGTVHLQANYDSGINGVMMDLNTKDLVGDTLELLSAKAIDDQTIELTFSDGVLIGENLTLGVRYLSMSGDSEVLANGKTAYFKGDWSYKDDAKNVVIWKLNSKNGDSLTKILTFADSFKWNKGARIAFVIMDDADYQASATAWRINGVTDEKGMRRLMANYISKGNIMTQLDIEVGYDLPVEQPEPIIETIYLENYTAYIIAAIAVAVIIPAVVFIVCVNRKKKAKEEKR
jgi:hypothetical protein